MNAKIYKCGFCEKVFSTKGSLDIHTKTATYCLKLRNEIAQPVLCEYCDRKFTYKGSLKTHLKTCQGKIVKEDNEYNELQKLKQGKLKYKKKASILSSKIIELEKSIPSQISLTENNLRVEHSLVVKKLKEENLLKEEKFQQEIKERDIKIIELEKSIEFGKGVLLGYEKVKPPTITNIVNQKLSSVKIDKIRPATIHTITEDSSFYDFDMYMKKEDGIVQFLTNMTQLKLDDGTIEQNYACTDKSRSTFHRLLDSREWKLDGGSKLINEVFDILLPSADEHWKTLVSKSNTRDIFDREYYANKMMELQSFHRAFGRHTKERKCSVNEIKGEIKDILSI